MEGDQTMPNESERNESERESHAVDINSRFSSFFKPTAPHPSIPMVPEYLPRRASSLNLLRSASLTQVPSMIRRGTRMLMESFPLDSAMKQNFMTTSPGVLRFKKKLKERHDEQERKRNEATSYATRHAHVLKTFQIRAVRENNQTIRSKTSNVWFMIYPTWTLYKLWQLTLLGFIYYQVIAVPYTLAFDSLDSDPTNDYSNMLTSFVFCCDILLMFNTAISDPATPDVFITDRKEIARRYLRGWFTLDFISSIPIDLIFFLINTASEQRFLQILTVLKVARLPRLIKISRLSRILNILRLPTDLKRWFLYSRYAHLIRLFSLVLFFVATVHMFACAWYGMIADDEWQTVIFNADSNSVDPYLLSFYIALQTIVGQNQLFQNDREYSYSSFVILVGAVVMAVVFGNVAILISNFYDGQNKYKRKMESLFSVMNLLRLPNELQLRIHEYYQVMYTRHGTLNGQPEEFKKELSKNLRLEVELYLRMSMIARTPLFYDCSNEVVQELVMQLRYQVYLTFDFVVVRGEVGQDMYFIQNGSCEVSKTIIKRKSLRIDSHEQEIPSLVMGEGEYFGEIALLLNCKRTSNVQAIEFSELCVLSRTVFDSVTSKYTEDRSIIEKYIKEKYDPAMLQQALEQHAQSCKENIDHDDAVIECLRKVSDRLIQVETMVNDLDERLHRRQPGRMSMSHQPNPSMISISLNREYSTPKSMQTFVDDEELVPEQSPRDENRSSNSSLSAIDQVQSSQPHLELQHSTPSQIEFMTSRRQSIIDEAIGYIHIPHK